MTALETFKWARDLFQYYLAQPDGLPESLEATVTGKFPEQRVMAYAYCDLDNKGRFSEQWLVLAGNQLLFAWSEKGEGSWDLQAFPLQEIEKFELFDGLSTSCLNLVGVDDKLLSSTHFTRRQSRAVGNLQFVAEQKRKQLAGPDGLETVAKDLDPKAEYQEAMLKAIDDAKATLAMPKLGVMMRLLSYMGPHRGLVILAFSMAGLMTCVQLLPPYLMRVLVDDVIRPLQSGESMNAYYWLWLIIGALAVIWTTSEFFSFVRLRVMSSIGEKICMKLREDLYRHMQKLSLSFFASRPTGGLVSRVSSDTDRLWDFITFGIIDIGMSVLQIIGVAVALLLQDWSLAVFVLMPIPLMMLMFYVHSVRIQKHFLRIWRKWSAMTAVLADVIPGIRVVKAFAQEEREIDRFNQKNRAVEEEAQILHRHWTRFWPMVVMLMHTCSLIVWVVGAPRVVRHVMTDGAEGMPLGVFLAFTGYMWMFWAPVPAPWNDEPHDQQGDDIRFEGLRDPRHRAQHSEQAGRRVSAAVRGARQVRERHVHLRRHPQRPEGRDVRRQARRDDRTGGTVGERQRRPS